MRLRLLKKLTAAFTDSGLKTSGGRLPSFVSNIRELPEAPRGSVEWNAFFAPSSMGNKKFNYFSSSELKQLGSVPARPFNYNYLTAKWNEVFDGMIVFRDEFPPHFLKMP